MNRRWLLLIALLLIPLLCWEGGVFAYAAASYSGVCPGLMDIPPYACSFWDYWARNTISPFAFPVHLIVCCGWCGLWLLGLGVWWVVQLSRGRQ